MQRRYLLAFGGAAALYLLLRLLLLWRFPPFYDEALYADYAMKGAADPAQRFISLTSGDEPLFPWFGMIAIRAGLSPLTAIRLVSLLAGTGTFVLSGVIARELGGIRVALATCWIVAITPFLVVHDIIGITDPLVATLVTAALLLQIRLARRVTLGESLLLGCALGGGVLSKSTSYPAIILVPFSLLLFDWSSTGRLRRLLRWVAGMALALLVTWGLYSLMKLSALWNTYVAQRQLQSEGGAADQNSHGISSALAHPYHWLSFNWPTYSSEIQQYVTAMMLIAAAVGFVVGLRRNTRLTAFISLYFLVPFAMVLLLTDIQYPRYIIEGIPALLVLAGLGVVAGFDYARKLDQPVYIRRFVIAVLGVGLIFQAAVFDARVLSDPSTARYPGLDDIQYVTGGAALEPYKSLDRELRRISQGRAVTVALGDYTSNWFALDFRNDSNVRFVRATAPPLCTSLYAVETQVPLPKRTDGLEWRPVRVFKRPRNGIPTTLYEAVVPYDGREAATPDELRTLIGGSDADYDAYGRSHPCIQSWEQSWYTLHPSTS